MRRLAVPALVLALAACGNLVPPPGFLGRMIDRRPPPVTVVDGAPTGALIGGPHLARVPDDAVDQVIPAGLRPWLTFEERQSLAAASQRAAVAPLAAAVDWKAHDGGDAVTATGTAVAVGDVYRSLRGRICRDVRQSFVKEGKSHAATVQLCREPVAGEVELWIIGAGSA